MQIAKREHEDKLRGNVANQQRIGINTSVISADDVKKLVPDFLTDQFDFAAYEPDSGYADATLTTNSFIEAAKRNRRNVDSKLRSDRHPHVGRCGKRRQHDSR